MNELTDPFEVLGVPKDASEEVIRARYLELVKECPPERDPERFQQIQAAFSTAKDPLLVAEKLLDQPDFDVPPSWSDAIDKHEKRPPNLDVGFLLSLGNRNEQLSKGPPSESAPLSDDRSPAETNSQPQGSGFSS